MSPYAHRTGSALTLADQFVIPSPLCSATFANERLIEQIKLMSQDELIDLSVRRKLMRVLLSWHQQFKNDPAMRLVAGLYVACGGGRKSDAQLRSEASELYKKEQERLAKEKQEKSDRKAAERLQKEERRIHKNKERAQAGQRATKQFNFKEVSRSREREAHRATVLMAA